MNELSADQKLSNLADALVEDIMSLPADELEAEIVEAGEDLDAIVEHVRGIIDGAIQQALRRP